MHEAADLPSVPIGTLTCIPRAGWHDRTADETQVTEGPSYAINWKAEGAAYEYLPYQLLTVV